MDQFSPEIAENLAPCCAHMLWAKSSTLGGYPIPLHILDVCSVASEIVARLPESALSRLSATLGLPQVDAAAWVGVWAGMHDVGKATPGFQAKWEPGRERAESSGFLLSPDQLRLGDRHDAFSEAIVDRYLREQGFPSRLRRHVAWAIGAHHGFGIANRIDGPTLDCLDASWLAAQQALLTLLYETTGRPAIPVQTGERSGWIREWLAGLISISDWIGSDTQFFPLDRPWTGYPAHWKESQSRASAALDLLGWPRGPALAVSRVEKTAWMPTILKGRPPRPLQTAVCSAVSDVDGPTLVVVEAPMGEGKTELALWIGLDQANQGSRGVYFALPTQATANGLAPRIEAFLETFSVDGAAALQLVHAGGRRVDRIIHPHGIDAGEQDALSEEWFTRRRRGLIAPMGVGTVDQALIGILEARHRFVRLFALADRLVVLDEVHAYDAYTGGLIERLVAWLGSLGSSVVLMSATLTKEQRDRLVQAWLGSPCEVPNAAYPRAVVASRTGPPKVVTFHASASRSVRVEACDDEDVPAIALRGAHSGAAVLIICNTVARAQARFLDLRNRGARCQLFHARYPASERAAREASVMRAYGPPDSASAGARSGIVIATQVVEQSLDLDFDVLLTDIAPVDLILQRIGRLHRHHRERPKGYEDAVVHIVGLKLPAADAHRRMARVYSDGPIHRTHALLRDRTSIELPGDIDPLVQAVYAKEFAWSPETGEEGTRADRQTSVEIAAYAALAVNAVLPLPPDIGSVGLTVPLDDAAESPGTRLGKESVLVIPVYLIEGLYRTRASGGISWRVGDSVPRAAVDELLDQAVRLSNRHVLGNLRRHGRQVDGWRSHGALVHAIPWIVDIDGESADCAGALRLDTLLGVVFGQLGTGE